MPANFLINGYNIFDCFRKLKGHKLLQLLVAILQLEPDRKSHGLKLG